MRASGALVGVAATMLVVACGGERGGGVDVPVAGEPLPAVAEPRAAKPEVAPKAEPAPAAVVEAPAAPELQGLEQPAVWPAPDVVFATPGEAATDFVRELLIAGNDPTLGPFQQGDSRSGEIEVLFAGEDGTLDPPIVSGLLSLRQLGPSDGWFVIAAGSDGATITSPAALSEVAAGVLTVAGEARGFEGTVIVRAFTQGDANDELDLVIARGGAFADVEPYTASIDLSAASPGDVVAILVKGDTGLERDPGTFAAIPVTIADGPVVTIPPTR